MSRTVCLSANTLYYLQGGGHMWVYLNWALGLRSLGCRVVWLEGAGVDDRMPAEYLERCVAQLRTRLEHYGLGDSLALFSWSGEPLPPAITDGCLDLDAAAGADLLLSLQYGTRPEVVGRFRRSALVDIDPGLLQTWLAQGVIRIASYDVYFTIGETVGQRGCRFPDGGLEWHYTPPCVALDWWPVMGADEGAPFTTISHWSGDEWGVEEGTVYPNDKRAGFIPCVDLPRLTDQPLELALCLGEGDHLDRAMLMDRGWRLRDAHGVSSTPWDYQRYVQESRGEFSCVKPSCIRFQNAWVSDRSLCYLASGKPVVVQHTGPSRILPDAAGLFRFRTVDEAARCLEQVGDDYPRQCRAARELAEDHFDARRVVGGVLERALA